VVAEKRKADKDEPEVFGKAKHTARNVAEFRRVCGKRVAGATFSGKSSERRRPSLRQQAATAPADHLAAMRAQMDATPIQALPLAENLTLPSGPGGNAIGLNGYIVEVKGFADSTGRAAMNERLSEDRAKAVIGYLMRECNAPVWRIVAPGAMGEFQPAASNESASGRAENRRVEVKVLVNKAVAGS